MVGSRNVVPLDGLRRALAGRAPGAPRIGAAPSPGEAHTTRADALCLALRETAVGLLRVPAPAGDWVLHAPRVQGLLLWGAFNPYAPAIHAVFLSGEPEQERRLLAWAGLTPFSQRFALLGAVEGDPSRETWTHTTPPLPDTLERACAGTLHDGRPLAVDAPSFLMPLAGLYGDDGRRAFAALLSRVERLESALAALRRYPARPWARANADFESRLSAALVGIGGEREDDGPPSAQLVARYLNVACSCERRNTELEALPLVWAQSIDRASRLSVDIHENAMPWEEVRRHLFALACG